MMKLGLVGALNVGSIQLSYPEGKNMTSNKFLGKHQNIHEHVDVQKKAGEELGMFRMGSTIVMMVEVNKNF